MHVSKGKTIYRQGQVSKDKLVELRLILSVNGFRRIHKPLKLTFQLFYGILQHSLETQQVLGLKPLIARISTLLPPKDLLQLF